MRQSGHACRQAGFVTILGFLVLLMLILFGIGSYFMIQDQNAKSQPSPTPVYQPVTIDKTNLVAGEILVTFKSGTTYSQARQVLQGFGFESYSSIMAFSDDQQLTSADIFKVTVENGSEQQAITSLETSSLVSKASLSYN